MDELSAGQASTLARNEAVVDRSLEELEELEEALCESIAESIRGRRTAAEKLPGAKKKKRCVRLAIRPTRDWVITDADGKRMSGMQVMKCTCSLHVCYKLP